MPTQPQPAPKVEVFVVVMYPHGVLGFPCTADQARTYVAAFREYRKHLAAARWWQPRPRPFVLSGPDWAVDTTGALAVRVAEVSNGGDSGDLEKEMIQTHLESMRLGNKMARKKLEEDDPFNLRGDPDHDDE